MLTVRIMFNEAEKLKQFLLENNLFVKGSRPIKENGFIYFPIKKRAGIKKIFSKAKFIEKKLKVEPKETSIRKVLEKKLTKKELSSLKTAYDLIGSIAIIEIDQPLTKKEKLIAETILSLHKNIKTVVKKSGEHSGIFRTQTTEYLAGEKTSETVHKENNVKMLLDVNKVYFSPRLSTERKRITQLVKKGELILVMFSGCGPYPLVISKNSKAKFIMGIEINPKAHIYAEKNIKFNKISNVKLYNEDVRKFMPKLKKRFDRIIMPLPKQADTFLDLALNKIKPGGTIHLYDFLDEHQIKQVIKKKIRCACKTAERRHRIFNIIKCGQHSPRIFRVCADFRVF